VAERQLPVFHNSKPVQNQSNRTKGA
jgi:hypothetical protein